MKAIVITKPELNDLAAACSFGAHVLRTTAADFPPNIANDRHKLAADLDRAMRVFIKLWIAESAVAVIPSAPDVADEPMEVNVSDEPMEVKEAA